MKLGALLVLGVCWVASELQAQHTISGVVRDSATGRPLAGASIQVRRDGFRRTTQTDDEGRFILMDVPGFTSQFAVRRLGFAPVFREITVIGSMSLDIALLPVARSLDTLTVRGGTGIFGVVGASDTMDPLSGANIQVLGLRKDRVTDSSGAFFIPIERGGTYIVRITRPGYDYRMFPVSVTNGRATDASRLLDTALKATPGLEVLWKDFSERLERRGMNSALLTGSELRRAGSVENTPAFNSRGLVLGNSICVFVNGTPRPGMGLDVVPMDLIEVIELYGAKDVAARELVSKWPARAECGPLNRGRRYVAGDGPRANAIAQYAVIWLKPEVRP